MGVLCNFEKIAGVNEIVIEMGDVDVIVLIYFFYVEEGDIDFFVIVEFKLIEWWNNGIGVVGIIK